MNLVPLRSTLGQLVQKNNTRSSKKNDIEKIYYNDNKNNNNDNNKTETDKHMQKGFT